MRLVVRLFGLPVLVVERTDDDEPDGPVRGDGTAIPMEARVPDAPRLGFAPPAVEPAEWE